MTWQVLETCQVLHLIRFHGLRRTIRNECVGRGGAATHPCELCLKSEIAILFPFKVRLITFTNAI